MSENPPENTASSVPPSARLAFDEWTRTGDDAALNRLIGQLFEILGIPDFERVMAEKGDAAVIKDDFGIDSLTLAEILFYTEDLLGVRIPNEEVAKLVTIGNLKQYLATHRDHVAVQ